jgi:hypothetical protein
MDVVKPPCNRFAPGGKHDERNEQQPRISDGDFLTKIHFNPPAPSEGNVPLHLLPAYF